MADDPPPPYNPQGAPPMDKAGMQCELINNDFSYELIEPK